MSKISDQRRLDILAAAYEEFTTKGLEGTSMADIAHRAGIGKSTIYEYFPSKSDLLSEACIRCIQDMESQSMEQLTAQDTVEACITGYCQVIWRYISILSALGGPQSMMADVSLLEVVETHATAFGNRILTAVKTLLCRGQTQGEIAKDIDLEMAALLLANLPSPRMAMALRAAQCGDEIQRLVRTVLRGLR